MSRKPFISQKAVRAALDSLVYAPKELTSPLLSLLLIDEFILNPDLPNSSRSREFALNHILTSLITDEVQHYLLAYQQQLPISLIPREDVLNWVANIAQFHSSELIGWIWLYLHYVDIRSNISAQEFCAVSYIDERTLRRYQQYATKKLTDKLIEREWEARKSQRKRRLYAELPFMGMLLLESRSLELQGIKRLLVEMIPIHIQVTGLAGIGKTVLVEAVLRELIDQEMVDKIVWLSSPPSLIFAQDSLVEHLLPEDGHLALRDYLAIHKTVIVLDDFELREEPDALSSFLQILSPAVVFITSRNRILLPHLATVNLMELDEEDAKLLIRQILRNADSTLSRQSIDSYTHDIWEVTGGNPGAIHAVASDPNSVYDYSMTLGGLGKRFENMFYELGEDIQLVWCVLSLMPTDRHYSLNDLVALLPDRDVSHSVFQLIHAHVVEVVSQDSSDVSISITNSARHYVEQSYSTNSEVKQIINRLMETEQLRADMLNIVENTLTKGRIHIAPEAKEGWIKRWWKLGANYHHWSTWRFLLEPFTKQPQTLDLDLYVGYGVCLRGIGEGKLAYQVFENAIVAYGRVGDFVRQGEVFVELVRLLRRQGEYEKASALLERAHRVATRHQMADILSAITLEKAQIGIDLKDMQATKTWIPLLPGTIQGKILTAEAYILFGQVENSREIANQMLDRVKDNSLLEARIHTILGRGYEAQMNIDKAHEHFLLALIKLEEQDDIWGLSRVQSNLGAILLKMRSLDDAQTLLSSAQDIQFLIGDRVGLAITQHNLRLLQVALSS